MLFDKLLNVCALYVASPEVCDSEHRVQISDAKISSFERVNIACLCLVDQKNDGYAFIATCRCGVEYRKCALQVVYHQKGPFPCFITLEITWHEQWFLSLIHI